MSGVVNKTGFMVVKSLENINLVLSLESSTLLSPSSISSSSTQQASKTMRQFYVSKCIFFDSDLVWQIKFIFI